MDGVLVEVQADAGRAAIGYQVAVEPAAARCRAHRRTVSAILCRSGCQVVHIRVLNDRTTLPTVVSDTGSAAVEVAELECDRILSGRANDRTPARTIRRSSRTNKSTELEPDTTVRVTERRVTIRPIQRRRPLNQAAPIRHIV